MATAQALMLSRQVTALLESVVANTPTAFGPATLVSITPTEMPFGKVAPYTLVFQPTAGGASLTLSVRTLPTGAVVGDIYSFSYMQGTGPGEDTISGLQAAAQTFSGVLVAMPSGTIPPYPYTLVNVAGGSPLTLNLAGPINGLTQYKPYSVVYTTAAENGSGYDQATFTPAG